MKKNMVGEDIDKIRLFVRSGKRQKVKKFIDQRLGEIESNKIFTKYQD